MKLRTCIVGVEFEICIILMQLVYVDDAWNRNLNQIGVIGDVFQEGLIVFNLGRTSLSPELGIERKILHHLQSVEIGL